MFVFEQFVNGVVEPVAFLWEHKRVVVGVVVVHEVAAALAGGADPVGVLVVSGEVDVATVIVWEPGSVGSICGDESDVVPECDVGIDWGWVDGVECVVVGVLEDVVVSANHASDAVNCAYVVWVGESLRFLVAVTVVCSVHGY